MNRTDAVRLARVIEEQARLIRVAVQEDDEIGLIEASVSFEALGKKLDRALRPETARQTQGGPLSEEELMKGYGA